jgi:hypothetical protein
MESGGIWRMIENPKEMGSQRTRSNDFSAVSSEQKKAPEEGALLFRL